MTISYIEEKLDKSNVSNEFDKIAKRYDLATSFSQGYAKDLERSVSRMNLKGDEYLADLCCGTGKSTRYCIQSLPNGKVIGIDNSVEMIKKAEINFSKQMAQDKVQFSKKDVMALDFPENHFDAIFMAYGIRNMPNYEKCLKNLYRMLKPGGKVCFHEYALAKNILSQLYWRVLGYGLIIPLSGLITGSTTIFTYLIKSVLSFPAPDIFIKMLKNTGFNNCNRFSQKSWRRPILHTFIAIKPAKK